MGFNSRGIESNLNFTWDQLAPSPLDNPVKYIWGEGERHIRTKDPVERRILFPHDIITSEFLAKKLAEEGNYGWVEVKPFNEKTQEMVIGSRSRWSGEVDATYVIRLLPYTGGRWEMVRGGL